MSDLAQFAARCGKFPAALEQARKAGTKKSALGMTTAIRATTRSVAPGGMLAGVGRKGAKVGMKAEEGPSGDWLVKATGPYQLIERNTRPHREPAASRRRKVLLIPGVGYRQSVHHPGTKGRHPFERAVDAYGPQVPKVFDREVAAAMAKTFR